MTTSTIEQRIDALDPDQINWNDANAYAALGVGGADDEGQFGDEQDHQGDINAAPASAPAAAPAPAANSSAAPVAAPAPIQAEPVDGIATADGKRIIPYAVLQATRRELKEKNDQLNEAQAALTAAQSRQPAGANDLAGRAAADPNSLTDEEMAELAEDYPSLAKPLSIIRAHSAQLTKLAAAPTPAQAAPVSASSQQADAVDGEEEFDAAIAANPLLASWMGKGGREWQRAQAVDRLLMQDPENAGLPYAERFAKVQRMVAAEFDVPLPRASAAPAPAPAPAAAAGSPHVPKAAALPSLSDIGGTPPQSADDAIAGQTTTDLLAAAERMTDEQLMRMAGLSY